ncbi:GDSL-type esterase/lipase family protein [Pseudonocardia sp. TRM90224]|uniref:GDSL-type esterase/lipase family protein n=1 Tax=Pseudonocardia sp. TRM90224 TaxID=2812678 RepID=UPI001E4D3325|nr:GDSL-type esterase/lipase family protein [Pseudonocardia sp. TRM90224]
MGLMGWCRAAAALACAAVLLIGVTGDTSSRAVTAAPVPLPLPAQRAVAASPAPLRIMPLGASSTVGGGSPATAGYRGPLQQALRSSGIAIDLVGSCKDGPPTVADRDHEGHGGWSLARLEPNVRGWVRAARPDVVLLHGGTNDLIQGTPAQVVAQRLDAVLADIDAESDAHVVVAGVWAPLTSRAAARAEFARLAAQVVAARAARGQSVTYVDTSSLLGPQHFTDGLHANAAGYRRIAAMWEGEIRSYLATRPPPH